jgi:hypothetical protein
MPPRTPKNPSYFRHTYTTIEYWIQELDTFTGQGGYKDWRRLASPNEISEEEAKKSFRGHLADRTGSYRLVRRLTFTNNEIIMFDSED